VENQPKSNKMKKENFMKNRKLISFIASVLFGFMTVSCDSNFVYEDNTPLGLEQWSMDSSYNFNFPINDTVSLHNMYINIRNSGSYKYQNLLLYIDFKLPNNQTIIDTVNCILSDSKGKWLGSGWGSLWSSQIPYKMHVRFPSQGAYSIQITHAMRDEKLKAISDIGIRIEKSK